MYPAMYMCKQYTAAGYCRRFLHSWQGRNPMLPELNYCSHATLPTTIRDRLHWVYQSPLMEHIGSAWTCYDFLNVGHIRCKFRHIIAHMILDWPDYYLGSARERLWLGKTQLLPSKMTCSPATTENGEGPTGQPMMMHYHDHHQQDKGETEENQD